MSFSYTSLFILSLIASSSAISSPHYARSALHHRALAARAATPVPAAVAVPVDVPSPVQPRRRAAGKRCRNRSSSIAHVASTSAVANAAIDPATIVDTEPASTSTKAAVTSTKVADPPHTTSTKADEPPHTTSTKAAEPPHTTTKATPPPQTTKSSSSSGNSNLPSFLSGLQTGQGTFYATGLGACGITNTDTDHIIAVSKLLFDAFPGYSGVNPNNNPVCNKKIKATYQGKSVVVTVTDRCEACKLTDLDFSPAAFNTIADPSIGRISGMTWEWVL